jgi:hypothetical protein
MAEMMRIEMKRPRSRRYFIPILNAVSISVPIRYHHHSGIDVASNLPGVRNTRCDLYDARVADRGP